MESLKDVVAILRFRGREDLSALLTDAELDFEYLDTLFPLNSEGEIILTNANIYAPITACEALRNLTENDHGTIRDALSDVWPATESGGTVIQNVSYSINIDSLSENTTRLYASPVGWQSVDRAMDRIRELLATASTVEQFQEVGVVCREGLISLAQAVFDASQHPPLRNDTTDVSDSDVKRMMARYVASECPGPSNQEVRKCVNIAVDLANKVTHRRTSVYRDAAFCAQTTINVIGLIAIISGRRNRS